MSNVFLWDSLSGHPIGELSGHQCGALQVGYSADGSTFVSVSYGETIVRHVASGEIVHWLRPTKSSMVCFALAPSANLIATAGWDHIGPSGRNRDYGRIELWDITSGRILSSFVGHKRGITDLGFSPDGGMLASGSSDGTVRIWNSAKLNNG